MWMTCMPKLPVASSEFQKGCGRDRKAAEREPVTCRDSVALRVEDFSEEDILALMIAEIPPEAREFDHEMTS